MTKRILSSLTVLLCLFTILLCVPVNAIYIESSDSAEVDILLASPAVKYSSTNDAVTLSWDKVAGAKRYIIYSNNNGIYYDIANTNKNIYTLKGLEAGKTYSFGVQAYSNETESDMTKITVETHPKTISGLKAPAITDSAVKLTWNKVANAKGYIVYRYVPSKKCWTRLGVTANNQYVAKGLKANTTYKFAVKAYITVDKKEVSSLKYPTIKATTKLASIAKFTATPIDTTRIKLAWSKVSGAYGYVVYNYNTAKKGWTKLAIVKGNSYIVKRLKAGATYKFAVRSYKKANGKTVYGYGLHTAVTATRLNKVTGITSATNANAVKLSWNKTAGATGYTVYRYVGGKWVALGSTKNRSYTVKKLKSGTSYWFTVKAYKTVAGKNIQSAGHYVHKTSTIPDKVNFKLATASGKVALKWSKVNGATGYIVYYKSSANGNWHKLKTTTGTAYTKTGLTNGKTYWFTVRAYRRYGKIYYSKFDVKSIKVESNIKWTPTLRAYAKYIESGDINDTEWNLICNDITNYIMTNFNGKQVFKVPAFISGQEHTVRLTKPLNLSPCKYLNNCFWDAHWDISISNVESLINAYKQMGAKYSEAELYKEVLDYQKHARETMGYALVGAPANQAGYYDNDNEPARPLYFNFCLHWGDKYDSVRVVDNNYITRQIFLLDTDHNDGGNVGGKVYTGPILDDDNYSLYPVSVYNVRKVYENHFGSY